MSGGRRKLFDVVCDHHHRGGMRGVGEHGFDGGEDLLAGKKIQARRRFIQQKQFRVSHERAGDEGADALART